ncbi:MAG TPA: malto-oligosyltrehalose trehalohydrolase [Phycisphaerales bacterium]|nr:malto-oligosyltrehalose trehalohydrolase [Phycisphaerales bacterium]
MRQGAMYLGKGRCRFTVWAPFAERMRVRFVDQNDRTEDLRPIDLGYWQAELDDVPAGARYVYHLGQDKERPDPASHAQSDGVHGPSRIVDHGAFEWADRRFQPTALHDYILYELHIGTFTPEGTFDAAIDKLDYLCELGVTAVEVMPVAQFTQDRNWGYDGVYPYAVQHSYGGPDGFKRFIDAAHRRGLSVVLDVVYNHLGPEGNYLPDFGPYFSDRYQTPWGKSLNFDCEYSDAVRDYFIENALFWFELYHIDALRLDALHAIFDMSATHFIEALKRRTQTLEKKLNRPLYLIGESDLNDVRLIRPRKAGGYELDAQWSDDFHHSLHALTTGESMGYYSDFGSVDHLAKAYREGFVYSGQYSAFRKRHYGNCSRHRPAHQFVVCIQNHDQVGNRMRGERLSTLTDFETLKLAAGAVLLSPYVPMLWMGEEYGETAPFLYFISHNDPTLVRAVRQGRGEEFSDFHDDGDCPDPQTEQTFLRSRLQWELLNRQPHKTLLEFYHYLITLRKERSNFADRSQMTVHTVEAMSLLVWYRQFADCRWCCVMNFGQAPGRYTLPATSSRWKTLLDSADPRWHGPGGAIPSHIPGGDSIELSARSIVLLQSTNSH